MHVTVTCDRCKSVLTHICNPELIEHVKALFTLTLHLDEDTLTILKNSEHYSPGDEQLPFFSEAVLYSLLGKDSGRSVLSSVNYLLRLVGLDPEELEQKSWRELIAQKVHVKYESKAILLDKVPETDVLTAKFRGTRIVSTTQHFIPVKKKTKERKTNGYLSLHDVQGNLVGYKIPEPRTFDIDYISQGDGPHWIAYAVQLWQSDELPEAV
jgi:hypothetical protein